MGGTIAAVANIMVISIGANPENNGLGYFVIAEIFLILALIGFLMLPHMVSEMQHAICEFDWLISDHMIFLILVLIGF